jgi:hypothetical protein
VRRTRERLECCKQPPDCGSHRDGRPGPAGPATKSKAGFIKRYRPVRVDTVDTVVAVTKLALAGSAVTFASTVSGPPVKGYSWDFGDGETGAGEWRLESRRGPTPR